MLAFDKDFAPSPDFPFRIPVPLVGAAVGSRENVSLSMVFYSDKQRTLRKQEAKP
jgi:hypothetical protein